MSNTNEHLKNRFIERYAQVKAAEPLIEDSIKMLKTINSESDCKKVVDDFLLTVSKYEVDDEDLNAVKQILHEFVSNEIKDAIKKIKVDRLNEQKRTQNLNFDINV